MASSRIGLTLALFAIVAATGCGDDVKEAAEPEVNDNTILIESLRTELAVAQSAAAKATTKLTKLDNEIEPLRNANGQLAKENANLLRQLSDANDTKVRLLKEKLELSKERFALLPREQQDRLMSYLDRMNARENIGLVGLQALANAGMIENDDARLVKAKAATGEGN
jgi:septal ring factor EnvC (AmiA/AmiB activator)